MGEDALALVRSDNATASLARNEPGAADDPCFLSRLGQALCDDERFAEAREWYERLAKIPPHDVDGELGLAWVAQGLGDPADCWRRCEAVLQRGLTLSIDDLEFVAYASDEAKQFTRTLGLLDELLRREPERENILNWKGYVLLRMRRDAEAEAVFRRCIDEERDGRHPLWNLAVVLRRRGAFEEAIGVLRRIVKKDGELYAGAAKEIAKVERMRAKGLAQEDEDPGGEGGFSV